MSETKFTPGPWKSLQNTLLPAYSDTRRILTANGKRIAETYDANHEANARLIAAAPELFQLLTESIDIMERQVDYSGELASILTRAKAVLAKI